VNSVGKLYQWDFQVVSVQVFRGLKREKAGSTVAKDLVDGGDAKCGNILFFVNSLWPSEEGPRRVGNFSRKRESSEGRPPGQLVRRTDHKTQHSGG